MAFTSISSALIQVGAAIKKELFQTIKDGLDDHESRLASVETIGSSVEIIDETVYSATTAATLTGVLFYKAKRSIRITKVEVQIFDKGAISSGFLRIDVKKSATLNPAGFASIMTSEAEIDFSTAANYDADAGTINSLLNDLSVNEFIRVDVTSLPATPLGKFRVVVTGEVT